MTSGSTIDPFEVSKFANAAKEWWDPYGQFAMLHKMNPVRVKYIRSRTMELLNRPLDGLRVLDIGCGGGLLSESLARLGAQVTGVDAAMENIQIAQLHKQNEEFKGSIKYELQEEPYDVVCGLEVIEHVANRLLFLEACSALTKSGGLLFFSTINRTLLSKLLTIRIAEDILRMVPQGTHDHDKYVTPDEFQRELHQVGCSTLDVTGLVFHPLGGSWETSCITEANYILTARKNDQIL